ncbi:MAG: Bug family tripartite tricarboxylate transporter substrate binding protein [Betaproteobacteria bacterium]
MNKIYKTLLTAVAVVSSVATMTHSAQAQRFPSKPVEISVWAAAGGGTDTVNRMIAKAMEKDLGGTIIVSNRTGGGGAVAMNHVWSRAHDGYNWLGSSEQMQIVATMGFHSTSTKDWRWYMVAGAPAVLSVRPDSRFKSLDDLVAAARANPGKVNIAHCPIGCVWHAKALGLAGAISTKLNSVPYAGSAPAMVAVLSGDGDAVISSLAEQTEYIKSGKLRPLAMVETTGFDFPGVGRIPSVGEKYPDIVKMPARTWLGFGVPASTPTDVLAKIDSAFASALKDHALRETMEKMNYTIIGAYGDESMKILSGMESAVSWALFDLGAAKISPDTKGIARP